MTFLLINPICNIKLEVQIPFVKILKARFKSIRNKLSLLVIKYDNYSYVLPSCVNLLKKEEIVCLFNYII